MSDNGSKPATIDDLDKLKVVLLEAMGKQSEELREEFRRELREAMGKQREELLEAIHDAETRLLKAFYAYAESAQKHFSELDHSHASLGDRLGSLEGRMLEVEKRLNMPPQS